MTKHSKTVGSSTAARVIACPRSFTLSKDIPNVESSYAAEGSMLHEACEVILNGGVDKDTDVIGMETEWGTVTQELYYEMVDPAMKAFDKLFDDRFEYLTEQICHLPDDIVPGAFGTADVLGQLDVKGAGESYSAILDWKFGRGVAVPAEDNKQLLFCASAGRETHPKMFQSDKIFGIIVQPGFSHDPDVWQFTHDDVDQFEEELEAAWQKVEDAPLKEGSHCMFCPAKALCPAKHEKIKRVQTLNIQRTSLPENEYIEGKDLSELLSMATDAEEWAKAVKKYAHEEMERGVRIDNWKLVNKRATRKWIDDEAAAKFLKGCRMKKAEIFPAKLITAPQAETWLKANTPEGRATTIRTNKFEELITSHSSGTTLAPESDKRPAVETTNEKLSKLKGIEA